MGLQAAIPALDVCKTAIRTMADFAGRNKPETLNPLQYGTTAALFSATAQSGAMDIPTTIFTNPTDDADLTQNALRVKYKVKRCNDDLDLDLDPCNDEGVNHNPWQYKDFLFTQPITHGFTVKLNQMRNYCAGDYAEEYANLLRETAETLMRKRNARYISQLAAALGKYHADDCEDAVSSASYVAPVALFDNLANPKPMGAFRIKQQYTQQGYTGTPHVIGGAIVEAIRMAMPLYAGNVNGFDISRLEGLQFFTDYQLDAVLNNSIPRNLLTIAPGSARPLTWQRFTGQYAARMEDMVKTQIDLGALLGLGIPLVADHSLFIKRCGVDDFEYIHKFYIYTDLFTLDDDMLSEDCGQCSNGILLWKHDCDDPSCEDLNPVITEPEEIGEG